MSVSAVQELIVALRKESVDRNINCNSNFAQKKHVALRKESVDRNFRGWTLNINGPVALRKESVDRNFSGGAFGRLLARRSPQGERG